MSLVDDATLLKMAEAEILGEAKRAAVRHSTAGISGWQPGPKANKMFLANTLLQTMASNRIHNRKTRATEENAKIRKRTERKLLQKKNKMDLETNFIYMKPQKHKEKSVFDAKTNKTKHVKVDRSTKNIKEVKKEHNKRKIKFKNHEVHA